MGLTQFRRRTQTLCVVAPLLAAIGGCVDDHKRDLQDPDSSRFEPAAVSAPQQQSLPTLVRLEPLGVYAPTADEPGAAEIAAFDPQSARLFVTNARTSSVDVLDLRDPSAPRRLSSIDLTSWGGGEATSVAVADGVVAIAIAATPVQEPGTVLFVRAADGSYINHLRVGPLPDNLGFSPDHRKLVVACEGEPSDDLRNDPKGTIAIIDVGPELGRGPQLAHARSSDVRFVEFDALAFRPLDPSIHIHARSESVAQDLEPEFVAISADSRTAWVSLQENNALAIVDLETAQLRDLVPLGETTLHTATPREFVGRPVFGMRQPDALVRVSVGGRDFVVSANEGDCRDYAELHELVAAGSLRLDPQVFPDASMLQRDDVLGRVAVSADVGDPDHDGDYDELHACGSRSISIWTAEGELVWDSGSLLEQLTAAELPHEGLDLGPAPEGVTTAELWGRPYVFVGLERAGGIAVFELSDPREPSFVLYQHTVGDMGPEGLEVIDAQHSPIGEPLLVAANEVSRTLRIYRIVGGEPGAS